MTAPHYRLVRPAPLAPVQAPVLDDAQRRVVDHGDGRLLVLAGPGTGKTATLVEAAVARVRDGVPIEHILILTFSRRAAGELRDRVTARLGGTVREPIARTFHSYAFGVLRMAAIRDRLPQPRLLSGPEQDVIVRELIAGDLQSGAVHWPAELAPALRTRAFARELRDLLLRAVERGLDGARLAELGRVRNRPEWVAAGEFMRQYANVTSLALPGAWDPARLIRAAINVLTADSQLLARERALRRHLLVDEYQDTDPAQADLLELLAAGADELIIVGDPDQSIYRFRGADESAIRDAFRRFGDTAGELPCVALEVSRRTGPQLLAATRRVAAGLPGLPWHRHLKSADGLPPGQLDVAVLRSASEEAAYIAAVLREAHLHDGLPWSRMAVLVRSTATTLAVLRRALVTAGVPVAALGTDVPLAEQPAVAHLLTALGAALRPESINDETAEHLLLGPIGGGDALQLRRLRRELRAAGNDSSLADAISDLPDVAMLPKYVRAPVEHVARVLSVGREAAACGGTAEDVLWAVWDATGLARVWDRASRTGGPAGAAADRDLDAVLELFAAAARFVDRLPGASAEGLYEHLAAQQIPGDTLSVRPVPTEAVQILTAHASKGLEWDLVCLAAVQEGSWPDLRRRGSLLGSELLVDVLAERDIPGGLTPQLQEERRLFYVATTRARQRLVVTAVRGGDEQPSRFLDELDSVDRDRPLASVPGGLHLSGLVAELRAAACDPHANDDERRAAATELARLAAAGVSGADPASWWGLAPLSDGRPVADPEHSVPVSPSRIESFLRCELKTLLEQLGAREDDQIGASLGSLIHEVAAVAPADADLSVLEALLDERWPRLDFGAAWFAANQRERARDMLAKLVQWIRDTRGQLTLEDVEQDFTVVVGDVQLRGRVDRVERDAHGRLVVVDLKTGASKPVRGDVPTNPQLGAYQVAVAAGGFAGGNRSGGARLVQLGGTNKSYDDQWQAPLSEQDDPSWISERIDYIAARMRGSEFTAAINGYCGNCDLKVCCPLTTAGRQVTS